MSRYEERLKEHVIRRTEAVLTRVEAAGRRPVRIWLGAILSDDLALRAGRDPLLFGYPVRECAGLGAWDIAVEVA